MCRLLKLIIICMVLSQGYKTLAQPITFTKVHNLNAYGFHFTVEKVNGGFVMFSRALDSVTLADMVYITRVDDEGNIIWSKGYGDIQHRYYPGWARSFGMLPDSTFYAGGNRHYSSGIGKMVLFRFDKNGDTLFTREYGGTNPGFDVGQTARATPDGGFVLAGATNTMGGGMHDFYIVKTDSLGNKLWEKTVGYTQNEDAWDMEVVSNGDIYVSGSSESFWGTPPGAIQPCVAKLNAAGELLWFKNYSTITLEFDGGSQGHIGLLNSKELILGASRKRQSDSFSNNSVIFKLDTSGYILWEKDIPSDSGFLSLGVGFISNQDSGFIISGAGIVYSDPPESGQSPAIIGKFDTSGNVIFIRSFYEPGYIVQQCIFDMIPTPDGIAAVGFTTAPQTPWMVKVDTSLCFGPDSCGPNLPVFREPEIRLSEQALLIPYPNPVKDGYFYIRMPSSQHTSLSAYRKKTASNWNMMDPLGSDFPHIHRDATQISERKKEAPPLQDVSDTHPYILNAYTLQGQSIPVDYILEQDILKVNFRDKPVQGIVFLTLRQGSRYWYGKVMVSE